MRLELDPIACEAHGLCAELLPERIELDEWGYPVLDDRPLPPQLEPLARRAAGACPTLALRLRADRMLNVSTQRTAGSVPAPTRGRKAPPAPARPNDRRPHPRPR
jgi:ferredoxin